MKKILFRYALASALIVICMGTYAQQSINLNKEESKINWTGKKPTGEHKGYVLLKEGRLLTENSEVTGGSFVMDMNSITNVDIKNDEGKNKLITHLKSNDFFDVQKFPTAKFEITNISKINNGAQQQRKATHSIEGDLTMKGVSRKVSFDASINVLNGKYTANTPDFTINRTEWGVNHQSKSIVAGLTDDFIHDDITLSIDLVSQ